MASRVLSLLVFGGGGGRAWAVGEGTRGTEARWCWVQRWSRANTHRPGNPPRPIRGGDPGVLCANAGDGRDRKGGVEADRS
eukprot:scaffold541_cov335-Pavlova_lutheri.AAC.14